MVISAHIGWQGRLLQRPPAAGRLVVVVDGKVHLPGELVAPHDTNFVLAVAVPEGHHRGNVVFVDSRVGDGPGDDERCSPTGVVIGRRGGVHVDVVGVCDSLWPGDVSHPQAPLGILGQHQRFGLVLVDRDGEPAVQRVGARAGVVAEAVEAPPVVGRVDSGPPLGVNVRGDVELAGALVPHSVYFGVSPRVHDDTSGAPHLVAPVQPVNFIRLRGIVPQDGPPEAVVPPELAFRLLARRAILDSAPVTEIQVACVQRVGRSGAPIRPRGDHHAPKGGEQQKRDQKSQT